MTDFIALLIAAQLSVGGIALKPDDFLDGRSIASGTGDAVVMLTLDAAAAARIAKTPDPIVILLDGKAVPGRVIDNVVEIEGQPDFKAAAQLAREITGKAPLPESL
jgi:hypothetical protein